MSYTDIPILKDINYPDVRHVCDSDKKNCSVSESLRVTAKEQAKISCVCVVNRVLERGSHLIDDKF